MDADRMRQIKGYDSSHRWSCSTAVGPRCLFSQSPSPKSHSSLVSLRLHLERDATCWAAFILPHWHCLIQYWKKDWESIIFHLIQTSGKEAEKWKSNTFSCVYSLIWWVWCWASWGWSLVGSCSCSFTTRNMQVQSLVYFISSFKAVLRILVHKSNQ